MGCSGLSVLVCGSPLTAISRRRSPACKGAQRRAPQTGRRAQLRSGPKSAEVRSRRERLPDLGIRRNSGVGQASASKISASGESAVFARISTGGRRGRSGSSGGDVIWRRRLPGTAEAIAGHLHDHQPRAASGRRAGAKEIESSSPLHPPDRSMPARHLLCQAVSAASTAGPGPFAASTHSGSTAG
jgi:hypothetical protein